MSQTTPPLAKFR